MAIHFERERNKKLNRGGIETKGHKDSHLIDQLTRTVAIKQADSFLSRTIEFKVI